MAYASTKRKVVSNNGDYWLLIVHVVAEPFFKSRCLQRVQFTDCCAFSQGISSICVGTARIKVSINIATSTMHLLLKRHIFAFCFSFSASSLEARHFIVGKKACLLKIIWGERKKMEQNSSFYPKHSYLAMFTFAEHKARVLIFSLFFPFLSFFFKSAFLQFSVRLPGLR